VYEDWLKDGITWRKVADKCVLNGLFSLAADLYGQALFRDSNRAQHQASLWMQLGKSCVKCGRHADARTAVQRALAIEPHNGSYQSALKFWSDPIFGFESVVTGPLVDILDKLPRDEPIQRLAVSRIQAIARDIIARMCGALLEKE